MPYFPRSIEDDRVVCDGCLSDDEYELSILTNYREGGFTLHWHQQEPWVWAPFWSHITERECDRCGEDVDGPKRKRYPAMRDDHPVPNIETAVAFADAHPDVKRVGSRWPM